MEVESSSFQPSPSSVTLAVPAPQVASLSASLNPLQAVQVETVNTNSAPNPAAAQPANAPSVAATVEALPEEGVQEETTNVRGVPNLLAAQIAETRRVFIATALRFRFGLNVGDTTIRFGASRNPLPAVPNPLGAGLRIGGLSPSAAKPTDTEIRPTLRVPNPALVLSNSLIASPNFRLPSVQIDLRV